jgi:hypothetical protein
MEDNDGRTRAVTDEVVAMWSENWAAVMLNLRNFFRAMMILEYSLIKYSWYGTRITGCKPGYPLLMMITARTNLGISQWKVLSWWQLCTM